MSVSLTAKLNKDRLKEALRRRRAARAITQLFDHSVPTEMRFHGVAFANRAPGKPVVRVADTLSLSPYIIHLNAHLPVPREWLDEERLPAPNLLLPERFFLSLTDAEHMNPAEDLLLSPTDTIGQILEDVEIRFVKRETNGPMGQEEMFTDHPEAIRAQFAPAPFIPPQVPENFATYFELPDDEPTYHADGRVETEADEDKDVVLTFSEMTITETAIEAAPNATERWNAFARRLGDSATERLSFSFLPHGWHRAIGVFVLASFVFVLPIHAMNFVSGLWETKSGLETASASALTQLRAGADAVLVRDAAAASDSFGGAGDAFSRAQRSVKDLGSITSLLLSAVPATGATYRAGTKLLEAGASMSAAGERIAQGVLAARDELNPTPVSRLRLLTAYVSSALPELRRASELIADVNANDVPEAQRATFAELADRLPTLVATIDEFLGFSEMAQTVLGADGSKRYLLVFQNNTEIRATGGFMGSFAELDVKDGVITGMNVPGGGTYDLQGSLRHNVAAPEPLQLLSARWEFQDANWFPDFPTTARQIMDFYEDAGGGSVDGVVAVNATYVANLIGFLGPVDMPEYGRTITSENFLSETQKIVELEYDRDENKPKAFIGDLAPILLDRVMSGNSDDFLAVLDRADRGLRSRDVQIYFTNDELERSVRDLGWGGEIKTTDGDYLMLVNTNLGGGKTDGVIREHVELVVNADDQGGITNTVTVTRTHLGEPGAAFSGVNNVNYARLYVPKGSTLLSASGFTIPDPSLFEIAPDDWIIDDDLLYPMDSLDVDAETQTAVYDEFGKTVFGNWIQTKPGTTSTYSFTYRLPLMLKAEKTDTFMAFAKRTLGLPSTKEYSLTIQKQSGVTDRTTHVSMNVPDSLATLWSSHDIGDVTFGNAADAFVGALFESEL
ncbi:hypothetical protein A2348_02035 [Candidatus Uhrbacteria bacterium RIFOXYB12_FULL_58_10]|uniref:DUF4012 domain-containing protein n=1 Tax=Candidatus Uhrbacteria bacterium RIFOXYB2_FULL_57_15 TaxID=1802422 RepID=A0A1F7W6Z1_9BACT|nr:MAG: hypothetical protein A2348_02035 [Candidatus Uhrbacteria bacterium RIFOXYB12_FULL_58_10]OGL98561.1 MAG: hypothetical protein A2304_04305 [Candidatus Uhrbacteria bacterium RIFOXYB2_FULL_57_15]OGL99377.1 MAG: hypothetical protein A2501_00960 [Candidatus Uhrbacteria bacterium RIFOXYC12_FULL_57_11]